jgi:hypothetical protein
MKRIINGQSYDTETAELIASGDHDHEASQVWWSLYRNRNGAFFEVYAGHDGVVDSFTPMTHAEARKFVETHANHLVEKYFGPVPEAKPLEPARQHRFSRRMAAIEMLERLTHAQLTRFLLELGPEFPRWVGDESKSMAKRVNTLIQIYDQQPDRLIDGQETISDILVEKAVSLLPSDGTHSWGDPSEPPESEQNLRRRLAGDGYNISDGKIRATLPQDIRLPELQDELRSLLKRHAFETALGHLDQALDGHARGKWATANSQLRTFLEGMLDEIAQRLDPATKSQTSENRRARLAALGFLHADLNEWGNDGKNFVNGLMRRLHPQGSHPGLSDEQDSTFRLHTVLITAHLFLVRFDVWK